MFYQQDLNFVPTPNWTKNIEPKEKLNLAAHIRRVERRDTLAVDDNEEYEHDLPLKLRIPKYNRPEKDRVSDEANAYRELVDAKFRGMKPAAQDLFLHHNNLNKTEREALKALVKW